MNHFQAKFYRKPLMTIHYKLQRSKIFDHYYHLLKGLKNDHQ